MLGDECLIVQDAVFCEDFAVDLEANGRFDVIGRSPHVGNALATVDLDEMLDETALTRLVVHEDTRDTGRFDRNTHHRQRRVPFGHSGQRVRSRHGRTGDDDEAVDGLGTDEFVHERGDDVFRSHGRQPTAPEAHDGRAELRGAVANTAHDPAGVGLGQVLEGYPDAGHWQSLSTCQATRTAASPEERELVDRGCQCSTMSNRTSAMGLRISCGGKRIFVEGRPGAHSASRPVRGSAPDLPNTTTRESRSRKLPRSLPRPR